MVPQQQWPSFSKRVADEPLVRARDKLQPGSYDAEKLRLDSLTISEKSSAGCQEELRQPPSESCETEPDKSSMDDSAEQQRTATTKTHRKQTSSVSFSSIEIREYDLTLGDHPECSYGPPVTLGWNYTEMHSIDVEAYEMTREPRRSPRQMVMNYYNRRNLLTWCAGHTEGELKKATREANRTKSKRTVTRTFLPASKAEEAVASATRKVRRAVNKDERVRRKTEKEQLRVYFNM